MGEVGIGTTTPYSRLTVWGTGTGSTTAFAVVNNASTTAFAVYDNGNATYAGSIWQSSDQRLKTDVESLDASSTLAAIERLDPLSYYRVDQPSQGKQLGFIAQDVQKVFPELTSTSSPTALTPDGTLTVNYPGLIAPIIKAIQALAAKIAQLASTVASFAERFTTRELCLGSTCVTEVQLQAVLAAASQSAGPTSQQASPPTPTTAPIVSATSSPEVEPPSPVVTTSPETSDALTSSPAITESTLPLTESTTPLADSPPLAPEEEPAPDVGLPSVLDAASLTETAPALQ